MENISYTTSSELQAISCSHNLPNRLAIAGKNFIQVLDIDHNAGRVNLTMDVLVGTNLARDVASLGSIADIRFGYKNFANWLASVSTSGKIYIFDIRRKLNHNVVKVSAHKRAINSIAFSPHDAGNLLLSGSQDGSIKVWDLRTRNNNMVMVDRKPAGEYQKIFDAIRCNEFSPHDDKIFCSVSDNGDISKWDLRMPGKFVNNIKGAHYAGALTLEWNSRFNYIVTGGKDCKAQVWNMANDAVKKPDYVVTLTDPVSKVSWSPSDLLATSVEDCSIACSYLTRNSAVDLWELRRPYIPSYSLSNHGKVVTGLHWHTPTTLWTVSKDRLFIEQDLRHELRFVTRLRKNFTHFNPASTSEFITVVQNNDSFLRARNLNVPKRGNDELRYRLVEEESGDFDVVRPIPASSSETSIAGALIDPRLSPLHDDRNNEIFEGLYGHKTRSSSGDYKGSSAESRAIEISSPSKEVEQLTHSLERHSPTALGTNGMLSLSSSPKKIDVADKKPKLIRSVTGLSGKKLYRHDSVTGPLTRSGTEINLAEHTRFSPKFNKGFGITSINRSASIQSNSSSSNRRNSYSYSTALHNVNSLTSIASHEPPMAAQKTISNGGLYDYHKDPVPLLYLGSVQAEAFDDAMKSLVVRFYDYLVKFQENTVDYNEILFDKYEKKDLADEVSSDGFKANLKSLTKSYFKMMIEGKFVKFIQSSVREVLESSDLTNLLRIVKVVFYYQRTGYDLIDLILKLQHVLELCVFSPRLHGKFQLLFNGFIIDVESYLIDIDYNKYFMTRKTRRVEYLKDILEYHSYYSFSIIYPQEKSYIIRNKRKNARSNSKRNSSDRAKDIALKQSAVYDTEEEEDANNPDSEEEDDIEFERDEYKFDLENFDEFYESLNENRSSSLSSLTSYNRSSNGASNGSSRKNSFKLTRKGTLVTTLTDEDALISDDEKKPVKLSRLPSRGEGQFQEVLNKFQEKSLSLHDRYMTDELSITTSSAESEDYRNSDEELDKYKKSQKQEPKRTRLSTTENVNIVAKPRKSHASPANSPFSTLKSRAEFKRGSSVTEFKRQAKESGIHKNASFSYANRPALLDPDTRSGSDALRYRQSNLTRQFNKMVRVSDAGSLVRSGLSGPRLKDLAAEFLSVKPWKFEFLLYQVCTAAQDSGDTVTLAILTLIFYNHFQKRLRRSEDYEFKGCTITTNKAKDWMSSFIELLWSQDMYVVSGQIIKHSNIGFIRAFGAVNTEFKKFCPHCRKLMIHEALDKNFQYGYWHCQRCNRAIGKCFYCELLIKGIEVGWLRCGHQGHVDCVKEWVLELGEVECPDCGDLIEELVG